ncbi:PID-CTERM protein-sorting domain-containing protein [Hymenobacter rubripertinctus]|uniref:VPDSG-CTERM sorting domain-containing protein n=1 Tax=Hymenobacter rubripertinctus TaxID=2029981 RepID=A0A418QMR9_9BACT|nr:hypothetical protein [Hymenobacter rubripertinctus]RIY06537.1 hypothetical protein D0T11_18495 [Hymenobacter rubripertinctus]
MKLTNLLFLLRPAGLLLAVLLSTPTARAQGPGSGGPSPDPTSPTAVPIDGGASLLLVAGSALALRHLRRPTAAVEQSEDAN